MQTSHRRLLALAWLGGTTLGCATLSPAQSSDPPLAVPDRKLEATDSGYEMTFDNGLRLFMVPDPYTRLVQFDVRQQVGAREDPDGKTGMAHFVEHLMFQLPSNGPGSPKLMTDIPRNTLSFNAYTAPDQTHYVHTGTAANIEAYMKYTALRLTYDCASVDDAAFYREREVVRNEHRGRAQGVEAAVYFKINSIVFPPGHPYAGRSLETQDEHLTSITPDDTCKFIRRFYTPSQATVVVTGDIDPETVITLAKQYLEPLPKLPVAQRVSVPPFSFDKKTVEVKAPVRKPTAAVLFPLPHRWSHEGIASQIAIERIFLALGAFAQREGRYIESFDGIGFGGEEAQVFGVAIETKRAADLDRGVDAVLDSITRGFAASLKGEEREVKSAYDSARQRARHNVLAGVASITSRSDVFAEFLETGKPGLYGPYIDELDNLSSEHVQAIGRKVFAREKAIVVKVVPDGKTSRIERAKFDYEPSEEEKISVPEDVDPAEASKPLPLEDLMPADDDSKLELELDNGMHVVLVTSSKLPVMELQLIIGAGELDGGRTPDLAGLVARNFSPNFLDVDARGVLEGFGLAGGFLEPNVFAESTTYNTRGLAIYLDFLIAGLAESVLHPEYITESLDYWKEDRREALKKQRTKQIAENTNRISIALFGEGHPHARPVIDDPRDLRDITLSNLEDFRAKHYRAANSTLIITGGFDMNLAIDYVAKFFGHPRDSESASHWQEPRAAEPRGAAPEPKPGSIRVFTQIDGDLAQTNVSIAYPLAAIYGDHHAALEVLVHMLNHEVGRVRHELGATYGVYAGLRSDRPQIVVGGALDSARAGEAFAAIKQNVVRLRDSEDFDRLFVFSRREVLRALINERADPSLLAASLATAIRNGQSYEYFEEHTRRIATLTPDQVKAEIDRVLLNARSVTVVQGPREGVDNVIKTNGIQGAVALPDVVHDE